MKKCTTFLSASLVFLSAFVCGAEGGFFPVGVCSLPEPGPHVGRTCEYPDYVHEILQHAGLGYSRVEAAQLATSLPSLRILVTVGSPDLPPEVRTALDAWITQGGTWISVGSVGGVPDWFGVSLEHTPNMLWYGDIPVTLGEGYLVPSADSGVLAPRAPFPLHFFSGIAVRASTCRVLATVLDAHQRPTSRVAMCENLRGKGRCILIAPDVTGTVVRIQQGVPIMRDGVPAPDGMGTVVERVLKTEDGRVLDWIFDRHPVPGAGELQAFTEPIADIWRELLLRTVLQVAHEQSISIPLLWFYPRNLSALATLSHDTDGNDPAGALRMLEELDKGKLHSTWCVLLPGYPKDVIRRIHESGHELATHFDAMTALTDWCPKRFGEQVADLTRLFDGATPVTNKNHILRWEGDTEFFAWCQAQGIQMDQSKGDCQAGEAGFLFGSCHPYRPVAADGKPYDVLELCTATQDLIMTAPVPVGDMIIDAASRHYGVAHFLFHPAHINIPAVADAFHHVINGARAQGMEWWMAREVSAWERARRTARWSAYCVANKDGHGKVSAALSADQPLSQATVLWLAPGKATAKIDGKRQPKQTVERWGFPFEVATSDLPLGKAKEFAVAW